MQWLIDIVKEWVQAQGYALESWVTLHFTPINVSGLLTPDATCTYFYAGEYNGKPYYRREDGAYFLWWNGVAWWAITTELGVPVQPRWRRLDPVIIGDFLPIAPTKGTATVSKGYKYLCKSFVDRGDPAVYDYDKDDLTKDGAWHDMDLSGIVPAGAKAVFIIGHLEGAGWDWHIKFRKKGNVNEVVHGGMETLRAGIERHRSSIVALDVNRKIQYKVDDEAWTTLDLAVKGWWL